MARILIVEDDVELRRELAGLLSRHQHTVSEVGALATAQLAGPTTFDLVVCDLHLPDGEGTALLSGADGVPVLIITGHASVPSAVAAMKLGAADYLAKPLNPDELVLLVDRHLTSDRVRRQHAALRREVEVRWEPQGMLGSCQQMRDAFARLRRAAATDATVLLLGESGTGKELAARAIHHHSGRASGPFVVVNCAAIPESLLESELFGHVRGAFTGATSDHPGLVESAHGGTLFLDEVGELPPPAQTKLLRTLEDGEVRRVGASVARRADVRLVAATQRDLPAMVKAGAFRGDLLYRLQVVEVRLPPLRDRGEDVMELARIFGSKLAKKLGRPPPRFTANALEAIAHHHWPGNVRELENALERALILSDDLEITPELLGLDGPASPHFDESLVGYFRRFVEEHQASMSETELARKLGISRKTLWERRLRLQLPRP